jgi:dUTP pyrophosphatase
MYILYLIPDSSVEARYREIAAAYLTKPFAERDAGFDLLSQDQLFVPGSPTTKVSQLTKAACYDTERGVFRAYWMAPRSSLSKTPLRLANSMGLIDAGYRGTLLAAVDFHGKTDFPCSLGDRYFQAVTPDLLPWASIQFVSEIPGGATLRGEGGFGSTGVSTVAGPSGTSNDISYYS